MASWLRLVTSNPVTRSLVPSRQTVVSSAYHFLGIGHQSYTTMPNKDFYDQSWVKNTCPKMSSMSVNMSMKYDRYTSLILYTDEGNIELNAPVLEKGDMRACVKHNTLLIQGKTLKEMKDGILKVNLPNEDEDDFKTNIMAHIVANIITSFRDITTKQRSWSYYDMFTDRSILGEVFCPVIAMLSPINSFSIYKEETTKGVCIWINMPGDEEKMKLTTQGLRVSLNMRERYKADDDTRKPDREDVKTFFDYDTFFIEEKTKNDHYITGIYLPDGIQRKHNMIKTQLKGEVFHAFLPCVKNQEIKIN